MSKSYRRVIDDTERESRGIGGLITAIAVVMGLIVLIAVVVTMTASSAHADEPSGDAATTTAKAGSNPAITSPEWHTVAESAAAAADVDSGGGNEPHGAIEDASGDVSPTTVPPAPTPAVTIGGVEAKCYTAGTAPELKSGDQSVSITQNGVAVTCIAASTSDDTAGIILIVLFLCWIWFMFMMWLIDY